MALADSKAFRRSVPTAVLLLAAAAAYGAIARETLFHGHTWAEEISTLIRSWWYVTGLVKPYTATDATWHMPLFFYQLGWWQATGGIGP